MKPTRCLHIVFVVLLSVPVLTQAQQPNRPKVGDGILEKVQDKGTVRVMVGLNIPWQPEERLSEPEKAVQRNSIAAQTPHRKAPEKHSTTLRATGAVRIIATPTVAEIPPGNLTRGEKAAQR